MRELVDKWRRQAEVGRSQGLDGPSLRAEALTDCADELELAWHAHAHDGAWEQPNVCRICDNERQAEEQYENNAAADWPDERQLNDWNIHNDHAGDDGAWCDICEET